MQRLNFFSAKKPATMKFLNLILFLVLALVLLAHAKSIRHKRQILNSAREWGKKVVEKVKPENVDVNIPLGKKSHVSGGLDLQEGKYGWQVEASKQVLGTDKKGLEIVGELKKPVSGKLGGKIGVEGYIQNKAGDLEVSGGIHKGTDGTAWNADVYKKIGNKHGTVEFKAGVEKPFGGDVKLSNLGVEGALSVGENSQVTGRLGSIDGKPSWYVGGTHTLVNDDRGSLQLIGEVGQSHDGSFLGKFGIEGATSNEKSDASGSAYKENGGHSFNLEGSRMIFENEKGDLTIFASAARNPADNNLHASVGAEGDLRWNENTHLSGGVRKSDEGKNWHVEGGQRILGNKKASLNVVGGLSKEAGERLDGIVGINAAFNKEKIGPMSDSINKSLGNDNIFYTEASRKIGNLHIKAELDKPKDGELQGKIGIETPIRT